MVDANQGWRMPGDLTPRWDVGRRWSSPASSSGLDVYWLEEPLPTDDIEGYAELSRATSVRIAAGEMVRSAAEARDLVLRGGVDVVQPDVVLSGGIEGARILAALAGDEGRTWSPHTWSNGYGLLANLHAALAFSSCPYLEVPFDPPAWSAERRDWLLPVTLEIAEDGTIGAARGPRSRCRPRLRRARAVSGRLMRIRAAVLRHPSQPVAIEEVELDPPKAEEVLVRVAAAGVCHSDVRYADGDLGPGRWPMVLGHEGAGVVESVGEARHAPCARRSRCLLFVPACRSCRYCLAGKPNLCETVAEHGARGMLMDGTSRLRLVDGTTLQHGLRTACFAERTVVAKGGAVRIPEELPLWQAALLGCGVVTGMGR